MKRKKIAFSLLFVSIFFAVDAYRIRGAFQSTPATQAAEATIRIRPLTPIVPGREVTLAFELISNGRVNAASFTINFDPTVFKYVSSALGADKPETAHLGVNIEQTGKGKFGLLVDAIKPFEKGTKQMVTAVFRVAEDARPGTYNFVFGPVPTQQGVSTMEGKMLKADYQNAVLSISERKSSLVGRVLDQDLRGSWHAKVILRKANGAEETRLTGSFGTFLFENLAEGTYSVVVDSKGYSFSPQTVEVKGAFTELKFVQAT